MGLRTTDFTDGHGWAGRGFVVGWGRQSGGVALLNHRLQAGTAAGEAGGAGAFELDVPAAAVGVDLFTEENGAAVAEDGEVAELVAGVGLGERAGSGREGIAGEDGGSFRGVEEGGVEPEGSGEGVVEDGDGGAADGFRVRGFVEDAGEVGVGVFEVPAGVGEGRGHEGGRGREWGGYACGGGGQVGFKGWDSDSGRPWRKKIE